MKKSLLLLLFCLVQGISLLAQTLSPQVLGSGGASSNDSASTRLAYTVGQTVAGYGAGASTLLSQGFHHGNPVDSLPYYNIGEIPQQTVFYDIEQVFYVWSKELGLAATLSIEVKTPKPSGEITFNPLSKRFGFKAAQGDKNRYYIIFRAVLNQDTVWQEVPFDVSPKLPTEQTAFGLQPIVGLPPADDDGNIIITEVTGAPKSFNHKTIPTASISIAGKTLVFDKQLANKLQVFCTSPREDVEELNLYAEKIIIRCGLNFKQANVLIHTRELVFEDGTGQAFISTTPADPPIDPIQGAGTPGLQAGSLTLYIEKMVSNPALRFRLVGGKGGSSSNGGNAGDGGKGGLFTSNLDLNPFADLPGGSGGNGSSPGNKGASGSFVHQPSQFSWLHPNALRLVILHAKAAYLNGHLAFTREVMEDYVDQLDKYLSSSEWGGLPEETQVELEQAQQEMATIAQRISNNRDYFGNPAGWVPMLSFEVNKIAFEQEIDRALRVLYFCYWVQRANSSNEQKLSALQEAKQQVVDLLVKYQADYTDAAVILPQLEAKAEAIVAEMDSIQNALVKLEQELTERAKFVVEEAHKPPKKSWWRKAAKILSIGAKVAAPVFPPVLGAIGSGLAAVSEVDFNDPWSTIATVGNSIQTIVDADFGKLADNFQAKLDSLNFTNIGDTLQNGDTITLKKYVKDLIYIGKPIVSNILDLKKKVGETQVPLEEIQNVLNKLKAESPEFVALVNRTNDLMVEKARFMQEIANALQSIATMGANIQQGILTVDGFNLQTFQAGSKRNLRAMLYVKDMESRAKERLIKYHYYMAKAYEYRILKAYPSELNLTKLFDDFRDMVEQENEGAKVVLTSDEFQSLRGLYDNVLSTVTEQILTLYNSNAPEISAPLRFDFTKEDLEQLNNGQQVHLNMVHRGMFPPYEENIRIVGFKVVKVKAHFEGGQPGSFSYFDLLMEHSGISKLKKDGEVYLFNHYNNENKNPIVWGVRYDATDGLVNPKEPSPSVLSLLKALLEGKGLYSLDNLVLYSRPAAWADIIVSKNDFTSNGVKMIVDSLRCELIYDFHQLPIGLASVEVVTNNDMKPYICVSKTDINERKDGWGSFYRSYFKNANSSTTLTAPTTYGTWQFEKWTDRFGGLLSTQPEISVNLGADRFVKANYKLIQPVLSVPKDTLYLPGEAGHQAFEVLNIGTGIMDWTCSGSADWLKLDSDSTGLNNGSVHLAFTENGTGNVRHQTLVALAASSIDYLDTLVVVQGLPGMVSVQPEKWEPLVKIYPNPSSGEVFVETTLTMIGGTIKAYDVLGNLAIQQAIGKDLNRLDFSTLPKGMYFIEVAHESRRRVLKCLLE